MKKTIQIAIDGPASAGKSTVAKIVANQLHYIYCDTGAMYRALTLAALEEGVAPDDEEGLLALLNKISITFQQQPDGQLVFLNERDVTSAIRQHDVTRHVSDVSAHKQVREEMVKRQQEIASDGGIVMDGRDIGTMVLPNAELKIFLVASVEERAMRRYKENQEKGIPTDYDRLKNEIELRDFQDSTRQASPLVQADDAILLDTTGLSIKEVVGRILNYAENARN